MEQSDTHFKFWIFNNFLRYFYIWKIFFIIASVYRYLFSSYINKSCA